MTAARRGRGVAGPRRPAGRPGCGVALDLGSARTRAWIAGRGLIVDVPTVTFPGTGAAHPVQRGTIVDVDGTARMLHRLLGHRLPRFTRPLVVVTAPVLAGVAFRERARAAAQVLRPRAVLTVPGARAVALGAGADLSRPLLVVDIGAHLTEVVLLMEGEVFDARRTALGTADLPDSTTPAELGEAVVTMVTSMLRPDGTGLAPSLAVEALARGALLAGGGALRPEITCRLADRLHASLRVVPSPHTAAVRGAARLLDSAHAHPSASDASPPGSPAPPAL
ncbi:hypothetical protein DN402_06615 [Streptomyces sp. SW4]|nr:hypothetical protein DN402_06615 [Streptomyces sp. SW4]